MSGTVSAFESTRHPLTIPKSGQLTLRLTWSDPVDLDLYLANGACSSLYPRSGCGVVVQSDRAAGNTETIAPSVTQAEQFSVWVDNLSVSRAATYTISMSVP